MSAMTVSRKRSFFEDLPSPTPAFKKTRCSSSFSHVPYSPPGSSGRNSSLQYLVAAFPAVDKQLIERVLDASGDDLDSAIGRLNDLCLISNPAKSNGADDSNPQPQTEVAVSSEVNGDGGLSEDQLPTDGAQWVELFVSEMLRASDMDDARARASRALEALEKSIVVRAGAEAAQNFRQERALLKEQIQTLIQENTILKRAVGIQHERQKNYADKTLELQHLKEVVSQCQQQLHTLEVNNYALALHLKQAMQNSSIPDRFNPDVF